MANNNLYRIEPLAYGNLHQINTIGLLITNDGFAYVKIHPVKINIKPKADTVEVVRCKDYEHYKKVLGAVGGWCDCTFTPFDMDPDDYCSHAEKKINEI